MQNPPKMKDVAKAAGVSPMTVSRAFKKHASVSQETRSRILAKARELGYVFDSTASNLRSKRTGFIAVTIPSLNNANFADTVTALTAELAEDDLQVLLGYTNYNPDDEQRLVEQLLRRRPDAIVLTGGTHTAQTRMLLSQTNIPVIEIWDIPEDPIQHVVGFSNAKAMEGVVDHLVAQGHRAIGLIGGEGSTDTRGADRRAGFVAAMTRHGLSADALVAAGDAPVSMQPGADAMAQLLATKRSLDAVVGVSDLSAFGAMSECQRHGMKVPKDIAVAGFGNFEISSTCNPGLTTVDACSSEIGLKAGRLLRRLLLDSAETAPPQLIEVQPKLIVRPSTAGPL